MAVEEISTSASVGSSMRGSGTSSTRTSSKPCHVTARMTTSGQSGSAGEPRSQLTLVEAEEALLVGADLGDRDLVEAGVDEGPVRGDVLLGVGPARRPLGGRLLGDQLGRLLEVGGRRQVLVEL